MTRENLSAKKAKKKRYLLREKNEKNQRKCVTKMGDEYTNISKKEKLSFCLWSIKENLEVQEELLGFHQFTNIKSQTIVNAIIDALLKYNIQFKICRGQPYDGASNILGKRVALLQE